MALWGYARGEGMRWQQQAIEAYASKNSMTLEGIAIEQRGVWGYTPVADRPIGGPLFAKLAKGDVVVVAALDRLFRSAVDALKVVEDLERRGVGLHIIILGGDMASEGRMAQLTEFARVFSEGEQFIGDRLAEAIRQRKADDKAKLRYAGGTVPFGFKRKDDGKLSRDKGQQEALHLMFEMKADRKSLRAIAAAVAEQGFKITHAGVAGILKAHAHDVWKVESLRAQAESAAEYARAETSGFWDDGEKFEDDAVDVEA